MKIEFRILINEEILTPSEWIDLGFKSQDDFSNKYLDKGKVVKWKYKQLPRVDDELTYEIFKNLFPELSELQSKIGEFKVHSIQWDIIKNKIIPIIWINL